MRIFAYLKRIVPLLLVVVEASAVNAQNMDLLNVTKLHQELASAKEDSTRALVMTRLAEAYRQTILDSTGYYGNKALELSMRIGFPGGEAKALCILCFYYGSKGDLSIAMESGLKALSIGRETRSSNDQACAMIRIGSIYMNIGSSREALKYFQETRALMENTTDTFFHVVCYWRAADAYMNLGLVDSAFQYGRIAVSLAHKFGNRFVVQGVAPTLGTAYAEKGEDSLALVYLRINQGVSGILSLAEYYAKRGPRDSALYYAHKGYDMGESQKNGPGDLNAALLLSTLYEGIDAKKALEYRKIAMVARDSLLNAEKITAATSVAFREREQESRLLLAQTTYRSRVKVYLALAGLIFVLGAAILLYRNNRNERRANRLLKAQRNEIARALSDLQAAQSQLVQKEKMASLGELTAGIAHEIQNPLNFVNNFSEVNIELADDLVKAIDGRDLDEARGLAADIKGNQEKIREHGKRADGIVKSMLQHSRASSGIKEPTDLASLADEYLKLSYHGMRAKDKDFNVTMETDFEPGLPIVNVVPQDIGRVLLNLYNNAFHAVMERKKNGEAGYEPKVRVELRTDVTAEAQRRGGTAGHSESRIQHSEFVTLRVTDNGPGIPDAIRDKIFQPFFTTKPTGQGTGLGLSLSYDIVTKGHGGELKLESQAGSGASFTMVLPV